MGGERFVSQENSTRRVERFFFFVSGGKEVGWLSRGKVGKKEKTHSNDQILRFRGDMQRDVEVYIGDSTVSF